MRFIQKKYIKQQCLKADSQAWHNLCYMYDELRLLCREQAAVNSFAIYFSDLICSKYERVNLYLFQEKNNVSEQTRIF